MPPFGWVAAGFAVCDGCGHTGWDLSCHLKNNKVKNGYRTRGLPKTALQMPLWYPAAGAGGAGLPCNAAIAAAGSILFAGVVDAVLKSARPVWTKTCGACRVITSPGSVRTAVSSTASAINECIRSKVHLPSRRTGQAGLLSSFFPGPARPPALQAAAESNRFDKPARYRFTESVLNYIDMVCIFAAAYCRTRFKQKRDLSTWHPLKP